jgi:intraflagellar transport protein 122
MTNFNEYLTLAEIYQAYHLVSRYLEESYRSMIQGELYNESVFNAARFLVNKLGTRKPEGISTVYVFYTLATLGFKFEMYKTSREGFEKLQSLKIPPKMVGQIEVQHLKLRSKPFQDKEGPLSNPRGDWSTIGGGNTVINFGSFDSLPLVEFTPDPSIPPMRVKELLRMDPPTSGSMGGGRGGGGGWRQNVGEQEQVLSMNNHDEGIENDLFA